MIDPWMIQVDVAVNFPVLDNQTNYLVFLSRKSLRGQ